jgi:hypothetical protein
VVHEAREDARALGSSRLSVELKESKGVRLNVHEAARGL